MFIVTRQHGKGRFTKKRGLRKRLLCNNFWCIKIHIRDGKEKFFFFKIKLSVPTITLRKVFMLNKLQGN